MLKSLLFILCFILAAPVAKAADWDVAVVFLGAQEPADFQADIDQNILELAKLNPSARFRVSVLRQLPGRVTTAFFEGSPALSKWDPLFFKPIAPGILVPGTIAISSIANSVLDEPAVLNNFLRRAFPRPQARRALVVYGHGEGFAGLRGKSLTALQSVLDAGVPRRAGNKSLDILWFDSCFMASLEVATQLRNLSHFILGAEDAEFSAGIPFESLAELESGPDDVRAMTLFFAGRFLESYSFVERGTQTGAVVTSSATVAAIETSKLDRFLPLVKNLTESLKRSSVARLIRLQPKMSMERQNLLDFGKFVMTMARDTRDANLSAAARPVAAVLELGRATQAQRSPRVVLRAPVAESRVMFGFADWTQGFEGDSSVPFLAPLMPTSYAAGPSQRRWPVRSVNKRLYVQPFQPGLDVFNAVFLDSQDKVIGAPLRVKRFKDIHFFTATRAENPILFAGHTVGLGAQSDRYTGLNVADPTMGLPSLEYVDSDFFKLTGWGQ